MKKQQINHIKWIWNIWKEHKLFIIWLFFLTLLSAAVNIAYPYIFKNLLDTLSNVLKSPDNYPNPNETIHQMVLILIATGLVKLIASTYPGFRAYMNIKFEYVLRKKYFSHLLKKGHDFFNKYRTGDLLTRLTNDLSDYPKISWFMCSGIFRAINSSAIVIFAIIVMFMLNWKLALISLLPIPITIAIFYSIENKLYRVFEEYQQTISQINNQLEISFSGARIIKAFVSEQKYQRFFDNALKKRYDAELKTVKLETIIHLLYQYIGNFAQIIIIIYGGLLVVKNQITIGTFYAFYSYLEIIIYPMLDLPTLFVTGKQAFVNIDRLEEIKNFPTPAHNLSADNKIKIKQINKICFKNVSFSYEKNDNYVIKNLDFCINRNEKLLLLGFVGSGKSTILGLLTGFLQPTSGEIYVNDVPLTKIDVLDLRNKIGFVPQETLLFSGTIRENVTFGMKDVSERDYLLAIDLAQMKNEIEKFKDSHDTYVGQRGLALSGGQKQRIAIARSLIRKPQVLLFDDITANLDAKNEEKLWNDLSKYYDNTTFIVVSNRISTIRYVDKIIFLNNGIKICEGHHEHLLKTEPEYNHFISKHLESNNKEK